MEKGNLSSLKGYLLFVIIWIALICIYLGLASTCSDSGSECVAGWIIGFFILPLFVASFAAFIAYVVYRIASTKKVKSEPIETSTSIGRNANLKYYFPILIDIFAWTFPYGILGWFVLSLIGFILAIVNNMKNGGNKALKLKVMVWTLFSALLSLFIVIIQLILSMIL